MSMHRTKATASFHTLHNTMCCDNVCATNPYPGKFSIGEKEIIVCKFHWIGKCAKGPNCNFAHQTICKWYPNCHHKVCVFKHVDRDQDECEENDDNSPYLSGSDSADSSVNIIDEEG